MKRKIELDAHQIRHIVETLGQMYSDAGTPMQKDCDRILRLLGVKDGHAAFKIAEESANRMLAAESKRWQKNMPGHGT